MIVVYVQNNTILIYHEIVNTNLQSNRFIKTRTHWLKLVRSESSFQVSFVILTNLYIHNRPGRKCSVDVNIYIVHSQSIYEQFTYLKCHRYISALTLTITLQSFAVFEKDSLKSYNNLNSSYLPLLLKTFLDFVYLTPSLTDDRSMIETSSS